MLVLVLLLLSTVSLMAQELSLLNVQAPAVTNYSDCEQVTVFQPKTDFYCGSPTNVCLRNGCFVLAEQPNGKPCRRGCFTSQVNSLSFFDVLMLAYSSELPAKTKLRILVRAWGCGEEVPKWIEVRQESELPFDKPCSYFQYRLEMSSDGEQSPSLRGLSVMTDTLSDREETIAMGGPVKTSVPSIVERASWSARRRKDKGRKLHPRAIIVHHTATKSSSYGGAVTVREIQDMHMVNQHWSDIGYHFLIGPDGVIYRGRKESEVGAHAPPNGGRLGISMIGNFEFDELTARAKVSLTSLLTHLCGKYGIAVAAIKGHGQVGQTLCPGRDVRTKLDGLKGEVSDRLAASSVDGHPLD